MRILLTTIASLVMASPAFADVAVDPCEGAAAGAACTLPDGGTGTCVDNGGTLECGAAATNGATNNATNGATNNATTASNNGTQAANNETGGTAPTNTQGTAKTEEKSGCSTVSGSALAPSFLVFALIFGLRRR